MEVSGLDMGKGTMGLSPVGVYEKGFNRLFDVARKEIRNAYYTFPGCDPFNVELVTCHTSPYWMQFRYISNRCGWAIELNERGYCVRKFVGGSSRPPINGKNPNLLEIITPHSLFNMEMWMRVADREVWATHGEGLMR